MHEIAERRSTKRTIASIFIIKSAIFTRTISLSSEFSTVALLTFLSHETVHTGVKIFKEIAVPAL